MTRSGEQRHRSPIHHLGDRTISLPNRCVGVRAGRRIGIRDRNAPEGLARAITQGCSGDEV
jgi:hypothetical protein